MYAMKTAQFQQSAQKKQDALPSGDILKVITSKESTISNIRTLVANNQFTLLQELKNEEGFVFLIQK